MFYIIYFCQWCEMHVNHSLHQTKAQNSEPCFAHLSGCPSFPSMVKKNQPRSEPLKWLSEISSWNVFWRNVLVCCWLPQKTALPLYFTCEQICLQLLLWGDSIDIDNFTDQIINILSKSTCNSWYNRCWAWTSRWTKAIVFLCTSEAYFLSPC